MTARRRVVVTGMGVVSAGGIGCDRFWQRLVEGRSSIGPITRFDATAFPARIGAEIRDFDHRSLESVAPEWRTRGRIAQYAAVATRQAVDDAGIDLHGRRAGVVLATGLSTYAHGELIGPPAGAARSGAALDWARFTAALGRRLEPRSIERRSPGSIPSLIAEEYGIAGPTMSVMTACAGGTQAIGDAARWIRQGTVDTVIAGGADCELQPLGLASFCLLGALSTRNDDPAAASRPFDRDRDGFVLGEGGAVLVLEERSSALRRGARIYAEVAGFGAAADAYRATDPHPEGVGAVLAMTRALTDAGRLGRSVDYINAHGTSTSVNDRAETLAIKSVFGRAARTIPISSTKSMIGHATVAAGAVEAVATVQTLVHQRIHPTLNQRTPDPDCDLDYVPEGARSAPVEVALSNSFAFGGQCATLVFERHRA